MCEECYSNKHRITPLRHPHDCLSRHTQYICSTCGRCICIECEPNRGLARWNFPFSSLETAKYYLRAADYTMKKACGIYEIINDKGRISYKILADKDDLQLYLKRNSNKSLRAKLVFTAGEYKEYPHTEVRRLTAEEIAAYMSERHED